MSARGVGVRAGAMLTGAALALCGVAGSASATTYTVEEATKVLETKLASEARLEGWASYSAADKQQIIQALGIDEFIDLEYRAASTGEVISAYGLELDEPSKTAAENYGATLVEDARATTPGGLVEDSVGTNALEVAGRRSRTTPSGPRPITPSSSQWEAVLRSAS